MQYDFASYQSISVNNAKKLTGYYHLPTTDYYKFRIFMVPEDYEIRTTMASSVYGFDDSHKFLYELCAANIGIRRFNVTAVECKLKSCLFKVSR